jgi:cytidylate kinase
MLYRSSGLSYSIDLHLRELIDKGKRMTNITLDERLFHKFIEEQIQKKKEAKAATDQKKKPYVPVVTVSIEPGSGGSVIARKIADRLGFDFYNREIIKEVAESVGISPEVIESLEKERPSGVEDLISSLIRDRYLWPGLYLEHLKKVLFTLAEHGRTVVVGRGANFILSPEKRFSLRVIAPLELRAQNIANTFDVSAGKAKSRIKDREEKRTGFIKNSFHKDVRNPLHYNMVVNTGFLSIEDAVDMVCLYLQNKYDLIPV